MSVTVNVREYAYIISERIDISDLQVDYNTSRDKEAIDHITNLIKARYPPAHLRLVSYVIYRSVKAHTGKMELMDESNKKVTNKLLVCLLTVADNLLDLCRMAE
jgi:hypothetical protein